jgi:nicotinamidase-related amidase
MQNYSLIVVDAQYIFTAARRCWRQIKQQIIQANHDNAPVIFVQFIGGCSVMDDGKQSLTMPELIRTANDKYIVNKELCDGGKELFEFFEKNSILPRNLKFCGVEFTVCVKQTIASMMCCNDYLRNKDKFNFSIVEKATSTYLGKKDRTYNRCKKFFETNNVKFID